MTGNYCTMRDRRWPFAIGIRTAPNGLDGPVMVGETNRRMVICDLRLPGASGFQIIRTRCAMERYGRMAIVAGSGLPATESDAAA